MESLVNKNKSVYTEKTIQMKEQVYYHFFKRLTDIVLSLIGLICLSPVLLIIALLIKVDDPKGKVIFKQRRVGLREKQFDMLKFRSMVSNAEELKAQLMASNEADGPVFKMKDDPRITKIGKFIRKTSIDELPQLINVLKGEMSLVGPRPALPSEVAQYSDYHKQRLLVTPGVTCIWQVSGRSNIGFDQWMELDLQYIRNRNYLLDCKLVFLTFFVLFGSKNAY